MKAKITREELLKEIDLFVFTERKHKPIIWRTDVDKEQGTEDKKM